MIRADLSLRSDHKSWWHGGVGGAVMDFLAVLDQVIDQLRQRGRLTYRTLKRQFELDDKALEDLKEEGVQSVVLNP